MPISSRAGTNPVTRAVSPAARGRGACGRAVGANVVAVGTGVFSKKDLEPTPPDYYFDDFSNPQSLLSLLS